MLRDQDGDRLRGYDGQKPATVDGLGQGGVWGLIVKAIRTV
jgi:hypothetical protein